MDWVNVCWYLMGGITAIVGVLIGHFIVRRSQ